MSCVLDMKQQQHNTKYMMDVIESSYLAVAVKLARNVFTMVAKM
jgi:hypothetical protein